MSAGRTAGDTNGERMCNLVADNTATIVPADLYARPYVAHAGLNNRNAYTVMADAWVAKTAAGNGCTSQGWRTATHTHRCVSVCTETRKVHRRVPTHTERHTGELVDGDEDEADAEVVPRLVECRMGGHRQHHVGLPNAELVPRPGPGRTGEKKHDHALASSRIIYDFGGWALPIPMPTPIPQSTYIQIHTYTYMHTHTHPYIHSYTSHTIEYSWGGFGLLRSHPPWRIAFLYKARKGGSSWGVGPQPTKVARLI